MGSLSDENIKALKPYFDIKDTVIVAPLHWGLGHAARCIPIIYWLKSVCKQVIIASDGPALDILIREFPDLTHYPLPSYQIKYKYSGIFMNIILGLPHILIAMYQEQKITAHIVKETGATLIFSDNRLGFRCPNTKNYYLTHQLNILHPNKLIAALGTYLHQWVIKKFDACFVPDFNNEQSLCPALSKNNHIRSVPIGSISRIEHKKALLNTDILVILSGPEPQRSILEGRLLEILRQMTEYKIIFIRGSKTPSISAHKDPHIDIIDIADQHQITSVLNQSKLLISRSGYTTIMDIHRLDIKAILIPTPGQTEQEYLADFHQKNPKYQKLNQNELNKLEKTIKSLI